MVPGVEDIQDHRKGPKDGVLREPDWDGETGHLQAVQWEVKMRGYSKVLHVERTWHNHNKRL